MATDGYRRGILKRAQRDGWHVVMSDHHVKLIAPDGSAIITSSSPRDWRTPRNMRARIRQKGFGQQSTKDVPKKTPKPKRKRLHHSPPLLEAAWLPPQPPPLSKPKSSPVVRVDGLSVRCR